MRTRAPRPLLWAALAALGSVLACDAGDWLAWREVPSFREVPASEGHALAARPGAHLIQAGAGRPLEGAARVDPEGPWPADAAGGGPVVIVAADPAEGYRLAARMARSGIQDVAVVAGGLSAWRDPGSDTPAGEPEVAAADRARP